MDIPQKNDLLERLVYEFNFPEQNATLVADKILVMDQKIMQHFIHWWNTGENPCILIEDFSFSELIDTYHLKPIAAFLTLDWLSKNPDQAKKAILSGFDKLSKE